MGEPEPEDETDREEESALRLEPADVEGARHRLRLDWRTFVYLVAAVLAAYATFGVFRGTSTMLTRVGVGMLIALALDPLTNAVQRRFRVGRGVAVAFVTVLVFLLTALLLVVLAPRAIEQAQRFSEELPATLQEMERLPVVGDRLRDADAATKIQEWIEDLPGQITDARVATTAGRLVSGAASILVVVVFALAVLIDGEQLLRRARRLLPPHRREQADEVGRIVYDTLGRYFGGSLTVALLMGMYVLALGTALGIPLAPLAAVWAMLTDLIPQVGGFLGGAFFVLLALTQSVPTAIIAGVAFVVYMNVENHLIQPAIVGRSVNLTPPTTMVAAFVGGAMAGVPGALVATPLCGAVKALYLEARGMESPGRGPGGLGLRRRVLRVLQRRSEPADASVHSPDVPAQIAQSVEQRTRNA